MNRKSEVGKSALVVYFSFKLQASLAHEHNKHTHTRTHTQLHTYATHKYTHKYTHKHTHKHTHRCVHKTQPPTGHCCYVYIAVAVACCWRLLAIKMGCLCRRREQIAPVRTRPSCVHMTPPRRWTRPLPSAGSETRTAARTYSM